VEQVAGAGAAELFKLGLSGVVIVALLFIAYRLFNLFVESQEKRLAESRETLDAINRNTTAMNSLTDVVKERVK
jgi:predicted signal transduction protein with EAL and GGDEF domain